LRLGGIHYYGKLDLAPLACTDITRRSFVNRTCYEKAKRFMVIQLKSTYYPYCEVPAATYEAPLPRSTDVSLPRQPLCPISIPRRPERAARKGPQ
jgi:hypothetical protein